MYLPTFRVNSIPLGQFIRAKRNTGPSRLEFPDVAKEMSGFFEKRGYPKRVIQKGLSRVNATDRKDLLKDKTREEDKDCFTFPITYSNYSKKAVGIVMRAYRNLQLDQLIGKAFEIKPTVAFRRGKNVKEMVVRTKIRNPHDNRVCGTFPCDASRCLTCMHTNSDDLLVGPSGWYEVYGRFNCMSCDVIYIITCEKCCDIYIGETCRMLKERFKEHRRLANYLLKHPDSQRTTEVGLHFSTNGHTSEDMRVGVIKKVRNIIERKAEEQRLMTVFGAFRAEAMNVDFDFLSEVYDEII